MILYIQTHSIWLNHQRVRHLEERILTVLVELRDSVLLWRIRLYLQVQCTSFEQEVLLEPLFGVESFKNVNERKAGPRTS
jgi:hypothetical protein